MSEGLSEFYKHGRHPAGSLATSTAITVDAAEGMEECKGAPKFDSEWPTIDMRGA